MCNLPISTDIDAAPTSLTLTGLRGRVKWFDARKGYGFIIGPEGQDVLVHFSAIQAEGFRSLRDGHLVQYDAVQGERGWSARNVVRIGGRSTMDPGVKADG